MTSSTTARVPTEHGERREVEHRREQHVGVVMGLVPLRQESCVLDDGPTRRELSGGLVERSVMHPGGIDQLDIPVRPQVEVAERVGHRTRRVDSEHPADLHPGLGGLDRGVPRRR